MAVTPPADFYHAPGTDFDEPLREYSGRVGIYNDSGSEVVTVSTDGTLAGNSDIAIPTEQAVRSFVSNGNITAPLSLTSATAYQLELHQTGQAGMTTLGHSAANRGVITSAAGLDIAASTKLHVLNTAEAAAGGTDGAIYTAGGISAAKTMQCSSLATHGGWIFSQAGSNQIVAAQTDTQYQLRLYCSPTGDSSISAVANLTPKTVTIGGLRYPLCYRTVSVLGNSTSVPASNPTASTMFGIYGMRSMPHGSLSDLAATIEMPNDWEPGTAIDVGLAYSFGTIPAVAQVAYVHQYVNFAALGDAIPYASSLGPDPGYTAGIPVLAAASAQTHQRRTMCQINMVTVPTAHPLIILKFEREGSNAADTYTGEMFITDWTLTYLSQQPGIYF
jgi:hypothetical protein